MIINKRYDIVVDENTVKRKAKIIFPLSGGNASKNSRGAKITLPKTWTNEMNLDLDNREVELIFKIKEKTISIKVLE